MFNIFGMWKNVIAFIGLSIAIFVSALFQGKKSEKNKETEMILKNVRTNKKAEDDYNNLSDDDKLARMRARFKTK